MQVPLRSLGMPGSDVLSLCAGCVSGHGTVGLWFQVYGCMPQLEAGRGMNVGCR